jgi:choline dehydrogenase-like flavoprotein
VVEAHRVFVEQFRAKNLGEITFDEAKLRQYLGQRIAAYNSASHNIGTTRMATDPKVGVVDENAKVHGVSNLYVAGSSIFPTGGHANPTLTIVAHALRLADHLKQAS